MEMKCNPPVYFPDKPKLREKNVLIVGGTTGVGEALANLCSGGGANVTVIGLIPSKSLDCQQVIFDAVKGINRVHKLMIGADYVFNNVGMIRMEKIVDTSIKTLDDFLNVNIKTMFYLTQMAIANKVRVAVNMSSRPVFSSYHSLSLYAATKHAIIDITRAASEESKTKFYAVCPSRINTGFRDSVYPNEDKNTRLTPLEVAKFILMLFNGKNPSGEHYWIRREYDKGSNSRNF